ncbi:MAG: hydrogenase expression/formation protein HypE [Candidatus Melainabacteria bacterium]|nr:hydrogenase expression/formation protein HypE [Candidatus Melainabacteria bacterium]
MEKIRLGHGSGGKLSQQLLQEVFLPEFDTGFLMQYQDAAIAPFNKSKLVLSTDSYVVSPIFFPGGNIGSLSIHGTINDLCMRGAKPLYIAISFIIEEGFSIEQLKEIVQSAAAAAKDGGVEIIAGDTKVVERKAADKIFITTTGVGCLYDESKTCGIEQAKPEDIVIASGDIGCHGMAIMCARNNFDLETQIESDSASLKDMVHELLKADLEIHSLHDITRGGLATCLNEIAQSSKVSIDIDEENVPVSAQVRGACEILGLDPLFVASEGRLVAIVSKNSSDKVLEIMHKYHYGKNARVIGVVKDARARVNLRTTIGSTRILDMLTGEQLPRIC